VLEAVADLVGEAGAPRTSIEPASVDSTSVRRTLRAAATYTSEVVRHAASACRRYSAGLAPVSVPSRTPGSPASTTNASGRETSSVEALDRDPVVAGAVLETAQLGLGLDRVQRPYICCVSTPLRIVSVVIAIGAVLLGRVAYRAPAKSTPVQGRYGGA
jgi:hypothetical protein